MSDPEFYAEVLRTTDDRHLRLSLETPKFLDATSPKKLTKMALPDQTGLALTARRRTIAAIFSNTSTAAATCPAPGTGMPGALNMLRAGSSMTAIAMTHDAPQGNVGMFLAVANSGCK